MSPRMRQRAQSVLGPWPEMHPELEVTNAGLHVVARAAGLGAVGGALIGVVVLFVMVVAA